MSARALAAAALAVALLAASPAPATTERLEWELLEAETALRQDEPRVAASHYRGALREAWYLLGLLAAAEGDLEGAREALARARDAAAVHLRAARRALALVELELGEAERPLRELRMLVREDVADAEALRTFVAALRATGREQELAAELEELRTLDPSAAAALSASAGAGDLEGTPAAGRALPSLEGEIASLPRGDARERLRARLHATLIRVYRNLAALGPATGAARAGATGAADLAAAAADLAERHPGADAPLGRVDLAGGPSFGTVGPPRLDPVALIAATPASLHPALARVDGGDLAAAEALLRGQLDGSDGPVARTLLGLLLAQLGRRDEAEAELLRAIETAERPGAAHQALARLFWSEERRDVALRHLRRAAALGPLDRDLALALADTELATCEGPFTVEPPLRALAKAHGSVEALMRLAEIALCDGREKEAFEDLERAWRAAPSCEDVLAAHGRLALELGIVSSVMRSIEPLVRMRPGVAEYRVLLGEAWRQRREMGEAVAAYLEAVALDPGHRAAFLPLALALNHENRYAEARPYFERHLETDSADLDALAGLAEAEQRLGDGERAERRASAVLAEDPAHARANLVLGMARMRRGELAAARESFARAVAANPHLAKAHYQLSLACGRLGDRACAAEHLARYQRALEGPEATYVQLQPARGTVTMTKQEKPDPR